MTISISCTDSVLYVEVPLANGAIVDAGGIAKGSALTRAALRPHLETADAST